MSGRRDPDNVDLGTNFQRVLDDLAELYPQIGSDDFFSEFVGFFKKQIPVMHSSIIEFRAELQPRVLYAEGENYDSDLEIYLKGVYLVDPFYYRYQKEGLTGSFYIRADKLENVYSEEGYRRYYRHMVGSGEIACSYPVSPDFCYHLSMFPNFTSEAQCNQSISLMEALHKTATNLLKAHVLRVGHDSEEELDKRRSLYLAVNQLLEEFGADVLTTRERQIAKLVLRGQSAKLIARELSISPGTVGIHRSNIYQKLGVSGQGELLTLFFEKLTR